MTLLSLPIRHPDILVQDRLNRNPVLSILFCLLVLCFSASTGHTEGVSLNFKESVRIDGKTILLPHIAGISAASDAKKILDELVVGQAPEPGETVRLSTSAVLRHVQQSLDRPVTHWDGPQTIEVIRDGVTIDKETIQQILATYLSQNLDKLPKADIRFGSLRFPAPFTLPKQNLTWEVIPSRPQIIGSSSFSIIFRQNGKTIKNCTVGGRLEAMADVVTATEKIRKGAVITADQLKMTRQNLIHLQNPYFNKTELMGMRAKRTIFSGRVVDQRDLESIPMIHKGELVRVFANKGSMLLSATGIATMDGREGDIIRIENTSSKKLIYCRVNSPGVVTVEF